MTNEDIIMSEAISNGIYTREECENFLLNFQRIPLHTFQMWKSLGYSVKKGQKAIITTRLWKFKTKKNDDGDEVAVDDPSHYYLAKAFLFSKEQVERV